MAANYKILGQSTPAANTYTTLYTVPASAQTVVATLNICNLDSSNRAFRIATTKSGVSVSTPPSNTFIAYETAIPSNDSIALTLGLTLATNDSIVVFANSTGNIAFSAYGSEVTP